MKIPIGTKNNNLITLDNPKRYQEYNYRYLIKCQCICGNIIYVTPFHFKSQKSCRECTRVPLPEVVGNFKTLTYCKDNNGKLCVKLQCLDCGNIDIKQKSFINSNQNILCSNCKKTKMDNTFMCISHFNKIKKVAETKNIEFNLTIDYLQQIYTEQNGLCALTGIPLHIVKTSLRTKYNKNTASLDKIEPDKGYVTGNVRWVHKVINQIKSDFLDEQLLYLCSLILNHNKEKIKTLDINQILTSNQKYANKSTILNMRKGSSKKKPVIKLTLKGEIIEEYESINDASRKNNVQSLGIIGVCKGKQKSSGGFIWKYKSN